MASQGLLLGHLNIFHLFNKLTDVNLLLNGPAPYHVFGLSETRLDDRMTNGALKIPIYTFFRRDAALHQDTGLIVLLCRNNKL